MDGQPVIRVNFHLHSSKSDGRFDPEALAEHLAKAGVVCAALTDHDSCSGSAAFREALGREGLACLDGVELTVETRKGPAHLLAFGMDILGPELASLLSGQDSTETKSERHGGPRTNGLPTIDEAIRVVHQGGGALFLAHPLHYCHDILELESLVAEFKHKGLDGIEAIYAGYGKDSCERLLAIADREGLAACAGGDFHDFDMSGQALVMEMPVDRWLAFRDVVLSRGHGLHERQAILETPSQKRGAASTPRVRSAWRILVPAISAIALFTVFLFMIFIPRDEFIILERKKETIRELTDVAVSMLDEYQTKVETGELSLDKAKREAVESMRYLRYGKQNKDYYWIIDMTPFMIMHPYRPELEGRDMRGFRDWAGKPIFEEFVNAVRLKDWGYVEYLWQWEDENERIVPKLSYVTRFKPWDWVIGTGIYLDDVKAEIRSLRNNLLLLCGLVSLIMGFILALMVRQGLAAERRSRHAENALNESRERYRALAEGSTDGTLIVLDGICAFANEAFCEMSGYSQAELQLFNIEELLGPCPSREEPLRPGLGESDLGLNSFGVDPNLQEVECHLSSRGGQRLSVIVSSNYVNLKGRPGRVYSIKELELPAPVETADGLLDSRARFDDSSIDWTSFCLSLPVSVVADYPPLCSVDDSLRSVTEKLRASGCACILGLDASQTPVGLISYADICACGCEPDARAASALRAPLAWLDPGATAQEALSLIKSSGLSHVALRGPRGRLGGVVSASDIAMIEADALSSLRSEAETAYSFAALSRILARASTTLGHMASTGLRARLLSRRYSEIHDAIAAAVARLTLEKIGPAPTEWALLSFGSMGRLECLPGSDQDNALVWDDQGDNSDAQSYFLEFGAEICEALEKIGVPPCPGAVMASMPAWNASLTEWESRLAMIIREPEPERLLTLQIFLDLRPQAGSLELGNRLAKKTMGMISAAPNVINYIALQERQKKVQNQNPRSSFALNTKELSAAFSSFIQLYAIKRGLDAVNTFERIDALLRCGALKNETGNNIADAYEFLLSQRLFRGQKAMTGSYSGREEALLAFSIHEASLLPKSIGFDFLGSGV